MAFDSFLQLVRLGMGNNGVQGSEFDSQEVVDWDAVEELAVRHGLLAVVLDGVERLKGLRGQVVQEVKGPSQVMWLRWIGQVMQGYEERYEAYCKAVSELARVYNDHGYRMMVLKGIACGMDWPNPAHRPYGDIDIWLFGKQKEADAAMVQWFQNSGSKFQVDNSHHHHTVFNWMGFTVENHYDFVNTYVHKTSKELEGIFKRLASGFDCLESIDSEKLKVLSSRVYFPSANLHGLFLIRHMVSHFAAAEITLRQVLDWGFFVEKHGREVDWKWLVGLIDKYHMKKFFDCVNAICVSDLGFSHTGFNDIISVHINDNDFADLKARVLADIITPSYRAAAPKRLLPRLVYKYQRWQGNAWKQRLCYPESRLQMFVRGAWSHLLKPAGI